MEREGVTYEVNTETPITGVSVTKYENGQTRSEVEIKDGRKDRPFVQYFENGQLEAKGTLKNNLVVGHYVWYHSNGQLGIAGVIKKDKWEGMWVHYEEEGNIDKKMSGTYEDGKKVSY